MLRLWAIMYAMLCTKPDVAYALGIASRFQADLRKDHQKADDSKSISGYIFILINGAVSWKNSKQLIVADSTTELEYVATSEAIKEAIWMKKLIMDSRVVPKIEGPVSLQSNNTGAVI